MHLEVWDCCFHHEFQAPCQALTCLLTCRLSGRRCVELDGLIWQSFATFPVIGITGLDSLYRRVPKSLQAVRRARIVWCASKMHGPVPLYCCADIGDRSCAHRQERCG